MNNFESNIQSGIDSFMQSILDNPSDYINTKLSAPESEAVKVEVERINQEVQQLRGILEEAFADELLQDQKLTSSEWNQIFTSIPSGLRQRFKIKSHKDLFIFIFCRNTLSNITSLSYSINREGHIISLPNSMHIFTYSPVNYAIRYDMQTGKQIYIVYDIYLLESTHVDEKEIN